MPSFESYLFNQQLPDNELYREVQNVVTTISGLVFSFTYVIVFLSPSSKESPYYKALVHSQAILLFLFCFIWSLLMKYVCHLNHGFIYSEGYSHFIGLTSAGGYVLLCVLYGNYGCVIICSYLFRLYLLVDHTHFLRMPNFFTAMCIVLELVYVILPTPTFVFGYSELDPKTLSFNLTQEQLDYLHSRSVMSYRLLSVREAIYPTYFGSLIVIAIVIVIFSIHNTVYHIKKKQSLMSAGATKHHLRVLRILTIQTVCIMSVSCFVPLAVTSTLFIDVHSYIVSFCLLALGMDSVINSLLTLYFNPVFKRTILTLFQTQFSSLRSNVSSVVAG